MILLKFRVYGFSGHGCWRRVRVMGIVTRITRDFIIDS